MPNIRHSWAQFGKKETACKERKRLTLEKKITEEEERADQVAAFERCEAACTCRVVPCPKAAWKRCPMCGPKKGLCKVRACAAARKPLLLGFNPTMEVLEGLTEGA